MESLCLYMILVLFFIGIIIWKWNDVKLNSRSLNRQWLFWISVLFPILSFIYFGSLVWCDYSVEMSIEGYQKFFDISKFPLYLLTASPIFGAFVISAHRSYQTEIQIEKTQKQIELAKEKNKIDIYFSKRKFVLEQLTVYKTRYGEVIFLPNVVIDKFFHMQDDYSFEVNGRYMNRIITHIMEMKKNVLSICQLDFNESNENKFLNNKKLQALLSFNELCVKKEFYFNSLKIKFKSNFNVTIRAIENFESENINTDDITSMGYDLSDIAKKIELMKANAIKLIFALEKRNVLSEYIEFVENINNLSSILAIITPPLRNDFKGIEIIDYENIFNSLTDEIDSLLKKH